MSDYSQVVSAVQQVSGVQSAAVIDSSGQLHNSSISDPAPELGTVSNALFNNISTQIKRMQRGTLQRLVLETEDGITLLSGLASGGLLVVFASVVEGFNLAKLIEVASRY